MPDNVESRMNFIIEQQARFTADTQILKERQADALRLIEANSGAIRQLVDVSMSLPRHAEETDRRLQETDRRLDVLIDVVDKLARRNGS